MRQAVERGTRQQIVAKGGRPFFKRAVAGDDDRAMFIAFAENVVQVLGGRRRERLQAEIIQDQQAHREHTGQETRVSARRPRAKATRYAIVKKRPKRR